MKFKSIFILFNVIIAIAFLFIFLMPLPVLGWEYAMTFWAQNWYIALVFLAILVSLDTYFGINWKLFSLLEREDWTGLKTYLQNELEAKRVLGLQKTRIYVNACLILQEPSKIGELRTGYVDAKVSFLPKVALSLGLPLILEGKADEIEAFLTPLWKDKKTGSDGPWIRWALAFALMLKQNWQDAQGLLVELVHAKKQFLLQLLSLYLLDNLKARDAEIKALLDAQVPVLKAKLTDKEWDHHIENLKERVIVVLFMGKLIREAQTWMKAYQVVPTVTEQA